MSLINSCNGIFAGPLTPANQFHISLTGRTTEDVWRSIHKQCSLRLARVTADDLTSLRAAAGC